MHNEFPRGSTDALEFKCTGPCRAIVGRTPPVGPCKA